MIIDAHLHCWQKDFVHDDAWDVALRGFIGTERYYPFKYPEDMDRLIKEHKEAGIDKAVLLGTNQGPAFNFSSTPNVFVSEAVKRYPDHLIGFGSTCSITKEGRFNRQSLEEVEKAVIDLGLKGIKLLIPYWGNYLPTDPKIYPLYAKIEELGVPVSFHQNFVSLPPTSETRKYHPSIANIQNAKPVLLEEVAKDFPDLKIIICHFGQPYLEETCMLMHKYTNIYADISGIPYPPDYIPRCLLMAKGYCVVDKVIYGTDGPGVGIGGGLNNPYGKGTFFRGTEGLSNKGYLDRIRIETNKYAEANSLTPLTETEIQDILGNTIAELLGIRG